MNLRRFIGPFELNTADDIYQGIAKRKSTLYRGKPIKQNTLGLHHVPETVLSLADREQSSRIPWDKIKVLKPPGPDTMATTAEDLVTEQEVCAMFDAWRNSQLALIGVGAGAFRAIEWPPSDGRRENWIRSRRDRHEQENREVAVHPAGLLGPAIRCLEMGLPVQTDRREPRVHHPPE